MVQLTVIRESFVKIDFNQYGNKEHVIETMKQAPKQ